MTSYTANLLMANPTPGDPAVSANIWPVLENTSRQLVDDYLSGVMSIVTTGTSTNIGGAGAIATPGGIIVPSSMVGQSDQARRRYFPVSGALTVNALVLMPTGLARAFSVTNNTTGSYILTFGVNNGAGGAVGIATAIPRGQTLKLFSDGTNVVIDLRPGGTILQNVFKSTTAITAIGSATPAAYLSQSFTPQSALSTIVLCAELGYESQWTDGSAAASAYMQPQLYRGATPLGFPIQVGGSSAMAGVSGVSITPYGTVRLDWQESSPGTGAVTYALYLSNQGSLSLTNNAVTGTLRIQEISP